MRAAGCRRIRGARVRAGGPPDPRPVDEEEDQHHGPAQQAQRDLGAGVVVEEHLQQDAHDRGGGQDGEHREEPHLHRQGALVGTTTQHDLRDRDQQVDEEDHRARRVQQEGEDRLGPDGGEHHGDEADQRRGEDRVARHASLRHGDQRCGRLAATGEDEDHPRGGVEPGVETAQHGGQHDRVHDVVGAGHVHRLERGDVRRSGDALALDLVRVVPRQDHREDEHRADEEHADPGDHGVGRLGDRPLGVLGLGGCDGGDLRADHREDHRDDGGGQGQGAVRHEPAVGGEVGEVHRLVRPQAEDEEDRRAGGRR